LSSIQARSGKILLGLILLGIMILYGCSPSNGDQGEVRLPPTAHLELPTILVDEDHRQFEGGGNLPYEVKPAIGLILDASGYVFVIPSDGEFQAPNMIQLMVDSQSFYGLPWKDGVTRYRLTVETLNPLGDAKPFAGLISGDQVAVAIGYQRDADNFFVLWAGIVNVR
jgi:hypothetical protein